ncbi:hypothetical protein BV22DRAFT_1135206 [Leucogyrophana mollusca]|uniref:Uncharacterized protein n=1 Tax=Leucogyrophana mollusca TaxID=85980 RepID=A0ACB8AYM2_9AGAM|nr:hypothetical protein BV22DRAFT_1135206 [Leucogyrophana mollusca]
MFRVQCVAPVAIRPPPPTETEDVTADTSLPLPYLLPKAIPAEAGVEPDRSDSNYEDIQIMLRASPLHHPRKSTKQTHMASIWISELPLSPAGAAIALGNYFSMFYVEQHYAWEYLPVNRLMSLLLDVHCGGSSHLWWGGIIVAKHSSERPHQIIPVGLSDYALLRLLVALAVREHRLV